MSKEEFRLFRVLFFLASFWNLIGVVFGYVNTASTFHALFDRELTDPLCFAIYRGAWGTTMVYFLGYLIVALNPVKQAGIVIVGGIGKVGYALTLLKLYLSGIANANVLIIIIGDFIFSGMFFYYFYRLIRLKIKII